MALNFERLQKIAHDGTADSKAMNNDSSQPESVTKLEDKLEDKLKHKESGVRSWLTIGFLIGLFVLIILSGFFVIYSNNNTLELAIKAKESGIDASNLSFLSFESLFSLVFNALGTPLGFIIGYYFKDKISKE